MRWPLLSLCGLLLLFTQMRAEVVYTTIGSGAQAESFPVGLVDGTNRQWAVAFKPYAEYTLTRIALPLCVVAPPGAMTLELAADENGAPGTPIETFQIDVTAAKPTIYTIASVKHPRLERDTQYWITAHAASPAQIWWANPAVGAYWTGYVMAFRERGEWSVNADREAPGIIVYGKPVKTASEAHGLLTVPPSPDCQRPILARIVVEDYGQGASTG